MGLIRKLGQSSALIGLLLWVLALGSVGAASLEALRTITVLYTNDEHGWMEPKGEAGGAAQLFGAWQLATEFEQTALVLSGGDMWTGPDISTWHDGASMVEVMNQMGYAAAAVGNHEYDFGLDALKLRAEEARFPLLAANLPSHHEAADFLPAYTITDVNGVRVGVVGLTRTALFELITPEQALRQTIPLVREKGAELLVVIAHLCLHELRSFLEAAAELGVAVLGGGHCNELSAQIEQGVAVISGGARMASYAKVMIQFDTMAGRVRDMALSTHLNTGVASDDAIANIVSRWRTVTDEALGEVIGYLDQTIPNRSAKMTNFVTDAWLEGFPQADAAMSNLGGFRQAISSGDITLGTILGVMPFDNEIIEVTLTGEELIQNVFCCNAALGGLIRQNGLRLMDGTAVDPAKTYVVLVNDFMFAGGDGFHFPQEQGRSTQVPWREPVIERLRRLATTPANPLDSFLDGTQR